MEISNNVFYAAIVALFLFNFHVIFLEAQQEYTNNKQSDCENPTNATLGNACNSVSSCLSYLTFRSISPYNTPAAIASLLNSNAATISAANDLSGDADEVIPVTTNLIVPVNCSCSGSGPYYQYNSSYVLQTNNTYFSVANNTFQGLTTCQALIAQNSYGVRNLLPGLNVTVPLRCACPTSNQTQAGFKYLITYMISEGESVISIAQQFGVDIQSVLEANMLSGNSIIFYFTPLMVPLKQEPNKTQLVITTPPPPPPPTPPSAVPSGDGDSDSSTKWVIVGLVVGAGLVVILGMFLFFYCRRRRQSKQPEAMKVTVSEIDKGKNLFDSTTNESGSVSLDGLRDAVASLTVYKFEELQKATNFFSEKNRIKGSVYRASFKGDDAAIKELQGDVSGEINILVQINHTNIIRLSGFCIHKGNTYLVYEFAENGSLDDWLHSNKHDNSITLNWKQRVQIAYDIADALNYLHNYTNPVHIHKNLNSGNVLLDSNFRAKVSNFGLARTVNDEEGGFQLTRHVIGTRGYMAPEYTENGVITPKMDVFAFGVVILELLSGREAIVGEEMLAASISDVLEVGDGEREKIRFFMDPILESEYPLDLAYSLTQLAKHCVSSDYNSRPEMSEVLMTLSKIQSTTLDWDPSEESQSRMAER